MKWLGQHIWNFISRFRNDVYLEDISTGTIASGSNLGLDSNNKIVKATVGGGGTVAVDGGGTGATSLTDGGILLGSGTSPVTAMAVLADGEMIVGDGTTDPVAESGATLRTSIGVGTGDSPQFTGIELGHASDTTIARSAAGVATIEGKIAQTRDKVIYMETSNFSDDINTDAHYIPFVTTSEHTSFANVAVPMLAPVAGKLLGVHFKANVDTNTTSNTVTFRLAKCADGDLWNATNVSVLGTKVVDGVAKENTCFADFTDLTTSGASGTNAFAATELIGVSMQNSVNLASTKYSVTLVFEFDFNSY